MTIKNLYETLNYDYEGALTKLGDPYFIFRFLIKLSNKSIILNLEDNIKMAKYYEAYLNTNELKRICSTLCFDKLYSAVDSLSDKLMKGENATDLIFNNFKSEYDKTISLINKVSFDQYI